MAGPQAALSAAGAVAPRQAYSGHQVRSPDGSTGGGSGNSLPLAPVQAPGGPGGPGGGTPAGPGGTAGGDAAGLGGGGGGVALGGACAAALAAAALFLLRLERRAGSKPVWHSYLPEVPPA